MVTSPQLISVQLTFQNQINMCQYFSVKFNIFIKKSFQQKKFILKILKSKIHMLTSYRQLYCKKRYDLCTFLPQVSREAARNFNFRPSCTSMNLVKFSEVPPIWNEREDYSLFLPYSTNLLLFFFSFFLP